MLPKSLKIVGLWKVSFIPILMRRWNKVKGYSKWGGFVRSFSEFDPLFFNISPREAVFLDPQERLFLESCWELLEDGGYTKERLASQYKGRVGVFVGITKTGFDLYGPELRKHGKQVYPHTSFSSVANRVSYFFNLQGPSMPIDTMCSSSLTAIHEACGYLQRKECEMAIAGGVNLYLHPSTYLSLCAHRMLSVDGHRKSFGKGGNGFVPGEGVGAVLLKRLSAAIKDEDNIYGVIRGTSVNHGGKTNGYTVPNPNAQGELIRETLKKAREDARKISYIEAHGTGTLLGDPIEITGLTQAFQKDTADRGFCAIGSAKSNIGHLEAAAGMAGLAKVLLQMQHKQIVPSLHAGELNPNIDFERTPFRVQQELEELKRPVVEVKGVKKEYPRLAGISSFGAGGANAHIIIEEAPDRFNQSDRADQTDLSDRSYLIVLSAKNQDRLKAYGESLLQFIQNEDSKINFANLAYTLQVGREPLEQRLGLIVHTVKELEEKLQGFLDGFEDVGDLYSGQVTRKENFMAVFAADEDMAKTIDAWISKRKYAKLLELWVTGLNFDWKKLYGKNKPLRIKAPTYPFARESYWIGAGNGEVVMRSAAEYASGNAEVGNGNRESFAKKRLSDTVEKNNLV